MMKWVQAVASVVAVLGFVESNVFAAIEIQKTASAESAEAVEEADAFHPLIRNELSKKYPGAKVDILGRIRWVQGAQTLSSSAKESKNFQVDLQTEPSPGEAQFAVREAGVLRGTGMVSFSAWLPAWTALRKISPGERLNSDALAIQEVNVSRGTAREFRTVILGSEVDVSHLEARQTFLEGQYLVSTGVQQIPDVRKGDSVRIVLRSGSVALTTLGTAEEPGFLNQKMRVLTQKTKRELKGQLKTGGRVEVDL